MDADQGKQQRAGHADGRAHDRHDDDRKTPRRPGRLRRAGGREDNPAGEAEGAGAGRSVQDRGGGIPHAMTVTVKLFALLRERAGLSELHPELPAVAAITTARAGLGKRTPALTGY